MSKRLFVAAVLIGVHEQSWIAGIIALLVAGYVSDLRRELRFDLQLLLRELRFRK